MIGSRYVDKIKGFEGYNPKPYWDYKQWTSGYGTRGRPGEVVDRATAEQRLGSELGSAYQRVNAFAPQAPEGVKAALTSLTFNAGDKWMGAGLGGLIKAGDYGAAKNRFLAYNKAGGATLPGLAKRRAEEASWFDGTTVQGGDMAPRGMAGGLAAISPEWANNIVQMGGSPAPGGAPTAEDDDYLKALASQMVQPYRPGWAGIAGIGNSIIGGMAMRELRKNQAARRGENASAMQAYLAPAGGGMAAPQQAPPAADVVVPQTGVGRFAQPALAQAAVPQPAPGGMASGDLLTARMDRARQVAASAPNSPAGQMALKELQGLQAKQMEMADPAYRLGLDKTRAEIDALKRKAEGGAEQFGKTGQIIQDRNGNFYSVQFGSGGQKKIEPLQVGDNAMTPSRGVETVGDVLVDKATGKEVRNVGGNLAGAAQAKEEGAAFAKFKEAFPKVETGYRMFVDKSDRLTQAVDRALSRIGPTTAGWGALSKYLPASEARSLENDLNTIRANVGFDELQAMRDASPTGGALGQVSEMENRLLQSLRAAMDQFMAGDDLKSNLGIIRDSIGQLRKIKEGAYMSDLDRMRSGGFAPKAPAQPQQAAPALADPLGIR